MTFDPLLATKDFAYLTTTGRRSGRPHEIEIWFALSSMTVYMMNGDGRHPPGRADWVRNLQNRPAVKLRIRDRSFDAIARIVIDPAEDALARRLLLEKYATPQSPLETWGRVALPVAIDLPS